MATQPFHLGLPGAIHALRKSSFYLGAALGALKDGNRQNEFVAANILEAHKKVQTALALAEQDYKSTLRHSQKSQSVLDDLLETGRQFEGLHE